MIRIVSPALSGAFALFFTIFCAITPAASQDQASKAKTSAKTTSSKDSKPKPAKSKDSKAKDSKSKTAGKKDAKVKETKADAKKDAKKDAGDHKVAPKPVQVASYGDWGAFLAQGGKDKTCYALASPKDRIPAGLQRDPAYVFISSRPAENVRNEISIIMGFPMKENAEARAEIGSAGFDLISKGMNAWVKNPAEEGQFIDAMKKGAKLVVKAPSLKGNVTTDSYSLAGFSQALDRVVKDCP